MKLGVSYLAFMHRPSAEIVRIAGEAGFRLLEVILEGHHIEQSREVLSAVESYSLELSVHAPFADLNIASMNPGIREESLRQLAHAMECASSLNARLFTIHPGRLSPYSMWFPQEAKKQNISSIEWLVEQAQEHGLVLCIENSPRYAGAMLCSIEELSELLGAFSSGELALTLDVGHACTCGDVLEYVSRLGSRISNVHLHDNSGTEDEHLAVGDGCIDFRRLLELLDSRYRGGLVIECHREEDVFRSRDALLRLLRR